jgi:hypothetical protein
VDLSWRGGRLVTACLRKVAGTGTESVRVVYADREVELVLGTGESLDLKDCLLMH